MDLPKQLETLEDFLTNPSFRKWVFEPDESKRTFWLNYYHANPGQQSLINHSFSILHNLYMHNRSISDDEVNKEIGKILAKIKAEEEAADRPAGILLVFKNWKTWTVAAALLVLAASIFLVTRDTSSTSSYKAFAQHVKQSAVEFINLTDTISIHHLPDGSMLSLFKHSKATYVFTDHKRQVFLEGKGFFDVKKNTEQPFVVHTNHLVARVLGTSFTIVAYPSTTKVEVIVRTGKVSVFKREDFRQQDKPSNEMKGLIVTANQAVILDAEDKKLVKQIVDDPQVIQPVIEDHFHFEATPVANVFETLMQEYAITILYDEESLANCTLTARLGNDSFFDKLNIITKAIGSTYVVIDGNVVVNSGGGCK